MRRLPGLGQDGGCVALGDTHGGAAGAPPQEQVLAQFRLHKIMPGIMEPADVASLYLFLASDLSANLTGQSINVDRGEVAW